MTIQLGERIELKNFEELEPGELTILKKMIGNHANHFQDFQKLHIHLKDVHKKEKSQKYQINALHAAVTDYVCPSYNTTTATEIIIAFRHFSVVQRL